MLGNRNSVQKTLVLSVESTKLRKHNHGSGDIIMSKSLYFIFQPYICPSTVRKKNYEDWQAIQCSDDTNALHKSATTAVYLHNSSQSDKTAVIMLLAATTISSAMKAQPFF